MILATLSYIVFVVSFHRYAIAALLPLAFFPVVLARLGDIDLFSVGFKVLLVMPFALIVGLINPIFDTCPHLDLFGHKVSGGWVSLVSIMIRTILTVAAALVLVAVLGIQRLCSALNRLGVPRILTTQMLFMHRYIVVLAGELGSMNLARELRSPFSSTIPLAVYGSLLGHLLLRTLERAQRIHQAMLSRGLDGNTPVGQVLFWRWCDTAFLATSLCTFLWIRTTNLSDLLGRWLLKAFT